MDRSSQILSSRISTPRGKGGRKLGGSGPSPLNPLPLLPVQGTGVGPCSLCPAAGARLAQHEAALGCHLCEATHGVPAASPCTDVPQLGHSWQHELTQAQQKVPISHCGVETPDSRREQQAETHCCAILPGLLVTLSHGKGAGNLTEKFLTENPVWSLLRAKFCLFSPKQSKDELMWISL